MKYEDMMLNNPDEDKCCINCEYFSDMWERSDLS